MPVDSRLSDAEVLYVGKDLSGASYPQPDERRVAEAFGSVEAADLVPVIHALEADFYRFNAPGNGFPFGVG